MVPKRKKKKMCCGNTHIDIDTHPDIINIDMNVITFCVTVTYISYEPI